MHPVIEFYLDKRTVHQGLKLEDLWNLQDIIIGQGYFYLPWLFPVEKSSKWNRKVPLFQPSDSEFFSNNAEIQTKFIKSFDCIINYFGIYRENNKLYVKDEIIKRDYWLNNTGHETKKISRIILSLNTCGQPKLAKNLQQLAIKLGSEKGYILPNTLEIWEKII